MLIKLVLIVIFLIKISFLSVCQNSKIIVVDTLSKKAISFPLIETKEGQIFYGNINGVFFIDRKKQSEFAVSCIGFYDKEVSGAYLKDTLYLHPKNYNLAEIVVNADKSPIKSFEIGYSKSKKKKMGLKHFSSGIVAVYIPYEKNYAKIDGVIIPVKKEKKGSFIRIHLYKANEDKTPGIELLNKNLIFEANKMPNTIDVRAFNLTFPKAGIFVGVEWVGQENKEEEFISLKSPYVLLTDKLNKNYTYETIPFKNMGWRKLDLGNNTKLLNAAFGLKVH